MKRRGKERRKVVDSVYDITYKRLWRTHCLGFLYEGRNGREREIDRQIDRKRERGHADRVGGSRRVPEGEKRGNAHLWCPLWAECRDGAFALASSC